MLKAAEKFMPKYSWIPIGISLLMFVLAFQVTRLFNQNLYHYDFSIPLDNEIPYIKAFILVYIAAYVQWIIEFYKLGHQPEEQVYKIVSAMVIGTVICGVIYMVFPTIMDRPEAQGDGFIGFALKTIYSADIPDNLFPSLHCFTSWWCFRIAMSRKDEKALYKLAALFMTLAVFASVVLVKQHLIVDIFGGVAVAEIGALISRLVRGERVYALINRRVFGNTKKGDESVKEYTFK